VQEQHDLAYDLLLGPAGNNPLRTLWADPGHVAAKAFARRGFHPIAGERCGDHDVATYVAQVNAFKREFLRYAAAVTNALAAQRWMSAQPPNFDEVARRSLVLSRTEIARARSSNGSVRSSKKRLYGRMPSR
jgi:hypothetical protein